jgi:hypothetical protein
MPMKLALVVDLWTLQQIVNYSVISDAFSLDERSYPGQASRKHMCQEFSTQTRSPSTEEDRHSDD